jgi:hypothetical protein
VIKDIFRKYPNKYESIIGTLCENLDTLDEPDAKAAMIWIVGEYSDRIDNADELLDQFIGGFKDEDVQVRTLPPHTHAHHLPHTHTHTHTPLAHTLSLPVRML